MILHVETAEHLRDYVIWCRFNDGAEGEVDLAGELEGEVFGPLKDKRKFKSFKVDAVLRTIVWENGADLAPEFLYENLRICSPESKSCGRTTTRVIRSHRQSRAE